MTCDLLSYRRNSMDKKDAGGYISNLLLFSAGPFLSSVTTGGKGRPGSGTGNAALIFSLFSSAALLSVPGSG